MSSSERNYSLDKAKIKFLLLEGLHPRAREIIENEGYGHIGSQRGIIAESMGMRVIFQDIENKLPLVGLDVESDNVSVLMKDLAEIPATIRTRILH